MGFTNIGLYKPVEAFKTDLEGSPSEAIDERCKVESITFAAIAGQIITFAAMARQMTRFAVSCNQRVTIYSGRFTRKEHLPHIRYNLSPPSTPDDLPNIRFESEISTGLVSISIEKLILMAKTKLIWSRHGETSEIHMSNSSVSPQTTKWELLQLTLRWKLGSWPTWCAADMTLDKVVDYIKREPISSSIAVDIFM
ncbi:hypothetical protein Tco_0561150 [Tanacetum coccineum]